ncbi:MAG: FAD/NAD(P)-binding protein [Candidatus Helarchaeota archaeon]|nr:FAD/NAD(P)-binding protein [Candidatus Helarchaeota archaeon]
MSELKSNPYIPKLTTIEEIIPENKPINDLKTFKLVFKNSEDYKQFEYVPGQFAELSFFGAGECPIGIASSPTEEGFLLFTVKRVGTVTTALHESKVGATIGIRGPFGNGWPIEDLVGHNIVIIGGGFAFSTLRSLTKYILAKRDLFKKVTVIYGARNPAELCYKKDLEEWEGLNDIELHQTIDRAVEGWTKKVGFVPAVTKEVAPDPSDAYAIICGPPIMIKFTMPVMDELGFSHDKILLSLENRMKCGIGKCGHCTVGEKYVCTDGPVFTQAQLEHMPREY